MKKLCSYVFEPRFRAFALYDNLYMCQQIITSTYAHIPVYWLISWYLSLVDSICAYIVSRFELYRLIYWFENEITHSISTSKYNLVSSNIIISGLLSIMQKNLIQPIIAKRPDDLYIRRKDRIMA